MAGPVDLVAMEMTHAARQFVAPGVLLDGRLGLFHQRQRWLAVADLHFGFELSQRAAGNLFPLWGMQTAEERLLELLADYRPDELILVGDLVHDAAGGDALFALVERLRDVCRVVLIAGNHDRRLKRTRANSEAEFHDAWQVDGFCFHHGDCEANNIEGISVIGHHHPAAVVRDGAGLRLKLPAFVQQLNCWILPAFSPWAGGVEWRAEDEQTQLWICSPRRIFQLRPKE